MPTTRRHRTQRERAAIHFLSNISLDGSSRERPYQADPGSECDCRKCQSSMVANANFIPPLATKIDRRADSFCLPATEEDDEEDELMDLWSLKSSTLKSKHSPQPLGDDPESAHVWSDGPKFKNEKIKMGPARSILKRGTNKRLIFTDGKPGAPVMITSTLPFHGGCPVTPESSVRPDSRETMMSRTSAHSLSRGRVGDGTFWPRRRRESDRSLTPTHRLSSGTHALAFNEKERKLRIAMRANRILTTVIPKLRNKETDAEEDGRHQLRHEFPERKLKPFRSKIDLKIDPPKEIKDVKSKRQKPKSTAETRNAGPVKTKKASEEVKLKDVNPNQILQMIGGLLRQRRVGGGGNAESEIPSTTRIEISFKSILNNRRKPSKQEKTPPTNCDPGSKQQQQAVSKKQNVDSLTVSSDQRQSLKSNTLCPKIPEPENRRNSSPIKKTIDEDKLSKKEQKYNAIKKSSSDSLGTHSSKSGKETPYNPLMLDDPDLKAGKHKTILTFPSYLTSIIPYVTPEDLKTELNEQFRKRFPEIRLTLSKLRSLKKDLLQIGLKCQLELATIAAAYVYFEKIVLKQIINKQNRKIVAANCLIIAAKLHDVKGSELSMLLTVIEEFFRVNGRDVLAFEMFVLVALEFDLKLKDNEVYPHFQRIRNGI